MTGLPGLASIPLLGRIFARNEKEVLETDIVMTLTPHVVRRPEIREEDLRSFLRGRRELAAPLRGAGDDPGAHAPPGGAASHRAHPAPLAPAAHPQPGPLARREDPTTRRAREPSRS